MGMTYKESVRILLEGVCGVNINLIGRETNLSKRAVIGFINGIESTPRTTEVIGMFIWRKMNSSILLCDSDKES
jgi:hypothetical protein